MNHRLVLAALSLVFILSISLSRSAHAEDWKKSYCNRQDYIPSGSKYPHLHCGKDFYTYSKSKSNHINMIDGDQVLCGKVTTVIGDIQALSPATAGKADMLASVTAVKNAYCK